MTNTMKEWQNGYELPYLKQLRSIFKTEYKPYCFGAFGIPNERDLATWLKDDQVVMTAEKDTLLIFKQYNAKSSIKDFTGSRILVERGDVVIKHIAGKQKQKVFNYIMDQLKGYRVLVQVFEEHEEHMKLIKDHKLNFISTKIAASSDLIGIYATKENHPYKLAKGEEIHIKSLVPKFLTNSQLKQVREELESFSSWADHYSGYNKRQSWSAFGLRGYDKDPNFIIKPGEMSQKWKRENPEKLVAKSDWTDIIDKFPYTKSLLEKFPLKGSKLDRVRFMRLKSGKGELSRHADITDREAGVQPGSVVRLHIPIITNDKVIFHSWSHRGDKKAYNMKEGSLTYLDVRKPHTATNTGDQDRIHLVIDLYASEELTKHIIEC